MSGSARLRIVLLVWVACTVGCASHRAPVHPGLVDRIDRVPVVLIPGITGTELIREIDDRMLWGDGRSLLRPHDGGHACALPLETGTAPEVEAGSAIRRIVLFGGLVRKPIYGPFIELMERNGYRLGDLAEPRPDDTFFVFGYDWRESAVDTAALLLERLDALRRVRGESRLRVHLVAQSNGAQIARYMIRFGGASLDEAVEGAAGPPGTVAVDKLILVGTANAGAIRVLREMNRGRKYVPWIGRKLQPEVFFTFRSLFESLPGNGADVFIDPDGRPLDVDVFDPVNWSRYGWSIYGVEAMERALRPEHRDVFVDRATIDRYLARSLDHARRLQEMLRTESAAPIDTRYYMIQNVYRATPARAAIECDDDGCRTAFVGDRLFRKNDELRERATVPGDGHATLFSQRALPESEWTALAAEPFFVDDSHFGLIVNPAAHRRILEFLFE